MTSDDLRTAIERLIDAESKAQGISRGEVWKRHPTLVDRWRDAPALELKGLKTGNGETVAQRAVTVITEAAHLLMWKDFGTRRDMTEIAVRAELWNTPEGRLLAGISRSRYGQMPWDTVSNKIAKDAQWGDTCRILRDGLPV